MLVKDVWHLLNYLKLINIILVSYYGICTAITHILSCFLFTFLIRHGVNVMIVSLGCLLWGIDVAVK